MMAVPVFRPATLDDIPELVSLSIASARDRNQGSPALWPMAEDAATRIASGLEPAIKRETRLRSVWLVGEVGEQIVAASHSAVIPVPPIYRGDFGNPGLLMGGCSVAPNAPDGAESALIEAAEQDLQEAGVKMIIGQAIPDSPMQLALEAAGYEPVTLYYAKSGFQQSETDDVRLATEDDVPNIVQLSARHRENLEKISQFWNRHPEADLRFDSWMRKSLTLTDRDMLVSEGGTVIDGYATVQPATALHFPAAHDISTVGHFDDFFHMDYNQIDMLEGGGASEGLARAAEAAFAARGITTALVVCPHGWASKRQMLEASGYEISVIWMVKWV